MRNDTNVPEGEILLKTENLEAGYRGKAASGRITDGLTCDIRGRTVISIIGPNGCGKTTLLRTLSGIIKPYSGKLLIRAGSQMKKPDELPARLLASARAAVFARPPDGGMLTVSEIVSLGRSPYTGWEGRLSGSDIPAVEKALDATGTRLLAGKRFSSLSDGEKQKVMIARAIAQDTMLVFLDEPAAFLDLPSRYELYRLLCDIRDREGKALLITTHDLDSALRISDRILIIDKTGKIFYGTPHEIISGGIIKKVFGINQVPEYRLSF